jgi:hypothetical protein
VDGFAFWLLLALIALGLFLPINGGGPKVSFSLKSLWWCITFRAARGRACRRGNIRLLAVHGTDRLLVCCRRRHSHHRERRGAASVGFLLFGALTSNLVGTTGASMLLIRPWLRMNKYRVTGHRGLLHIYRFQRWWMHTGGRSAAVFGLSEGIHSGGSQNIAGRHGRWAWALLALFIWLMNETIYTPLASQAARGTD